MSVRTLAYLALVAALVAGPHHAGAQGDATTTTTPAPAAPAAPVEAPEVTEVLGSVPQEFVGRWLMVGSIKLPSGQERPVPRTIEIRKGPEHLEVRVTREPLPESVNKKIEAASQKGTAWTPDAEDLKTVDESWGKLPKIEVSYAKIDHKILAAEAYTAEYQEDETTKDAKFAITINEQFAGRTGAIRSYAVYGVQQLTGDTMSGRYLTSTIAAAPMPIPIVLKGDFKGYRLGGAGAPAPASGGSWLDRLFAGCRG
jgi:hypothetical protein